MPERGDCLVRLPPLSAEDVAILEDVVRDEQIPCKRLVIEVIYEPQYLWRRFVAPKNNKRHNSLLYNLLCRY